MSFMQMHRTIFLLLWTVRMRSGLAIDVYKRQDLLDEHDFIEDAYILEVSSPGLGRPLKKDKDFARSIGEEVDVKTFRAIQHQKDFTGILKAYDKEKIVLELEGGEEMTFARADIALVRLAFDF